MEPDKEGFFKETKKLAEEYVKERLLLLKLQTAEKSARILSAVFTGLIIGTLCFFVLLFVSVMAGYFLAGLTGSFYIGFGIVTLLYMIAALLAFFFRKTVLYKFFSDSIVRMFFENENN